MATGPSSNVCGCGGFPKPTSNSQVPAGHHQRWHLSPQVKGSVPQDHLPLQMPLASPGCASHQASNRSLQQPHPTRDANSKCCLYFWPTGSKSEAPMIPSSGSIDLLTEPRKPVYSSDYQFITKDIKGHKSRARWRDNWVRSWTKELHPPWNLGPYMVACGNDLAPQPRSALNPLFLGYYGAFILWAWLINPVSLVIDWTSSPSLTQKVGLKVPTLYL